MPSRRFPCVALLPVVALLTLLGCGGSGFDGEVDVPDGYATYRGDGVSFIHPEAWKPTTRDIGHGITELRFQDPAADEPAAAVLLTLKSDVGDRFDTLLDGEQVFLESTGATIDRDEVDVPGARKAYLSHIKVPDRGTGPSTSQALDVLEPDGRKVVLAAGAPDRDDDPVDADAVIASLRLEQP